MLEVSNFSNDYGKFKLKNVSFTLDKGYIMGFIGPNGSGKSTTINLIMNLIKRDSGSIKVMGKDNLKNEIDIKQEIGFVYDANYYYEELQISQMKLVISKFYKNWSDDLYSKYLNVFNLDESKKIKDLSKGMQMKFSLLMALSHNPKLIIMDEPTSGLDPVFRSEILDILYNIIQDEDKSILFSSHITSDLDKIADYITFINNGEILFTKTRDEINETYSVIKGKNSILENNQDLEKNFIGIRKSSYGFEGLTTKVNELKKQINEKIIVEKPSLDDIMVFFSRESV